MQNLLSNKKAPLPYWAATTGWALLIFILYSMPDSAIFLLNSRAADGITTLITILFGTEFKKDILLITIAIVEKGLMTPFFAVLSLLFWVSLYKNGYKPVKASVFSFFISSAAAMLFELYRLQFIGDKPLSPGFNIAAALAAQAAVLFVRWLKKRFPWAINRETISYIVFGVLTTLINLLVYGICYNTFKIHNLISNIIAWVAAVLFAYVVNKRFVFRSKTYTTAQTIREFKLFVGARLFSLAFDELGMWLTVNKLSLNGGISKIIMNIFVLVSNYFFSKLIIFKSERPD